MLSTMSFCSECLPHLSVFCLSSLAFSRLLHKWNLTVCSLLSLASPTQHKASEVIHVVVTISSSSLLIVG